jgi:hypothetical protein
MIEYRFRVPSAAVFTLYLYSKVLEYRFRVPNAASLRKPLYHLAFLADEKLQPGGWLDIKQTEDD